MRLTFFCTNKRVSTVANLFEKNSISSCSQENFVIFIRLIMTDLSNTRLKGARIEKLILDKIADSLCYVQK